VYQYHDHNRYQGKHVVEPSVVKRKLEPTMQMDPQVPDRRKDTSEQVEDTYRFRLFMAPAAST
jgi:hypothetical protein